MRWIYPITVEFKCITKQRIVQTKLKNTNYLIFSEINVFMYLRDVFKSGAIKTGIFCVAIFVNVELVNSQSIRYEAFHGSFIIKFRDKINKEIYPLLVHTDPTIAKRKDVIEILDEQFAKGVKKKIIIDYSDSTWTTTIGFNNIKQGTRVHEKKMFRDSCLIGAGYLKKTSQELMISGLKCRKFVIESDSMIINLWVTDSYNYDFAKVFELLLHSGMINQQFKNRNWLKVHLKRGMIIKVDIRDSNNNQQEIMLSEIKFGESIDGFEDISGYKIADIPEGQNCGVIEIEK